MRQLVRDQGVPDRRPRPVLALGERHVLPDRHRPRPQPADQAAGAAIGVDPDAGKVVPQRRPHPRLQLAGQRLALAQLRAQDRRRGVVGGGARPPFEQRPPEGRQPAADRPDDRGRRAGDTRHRTGGHRRGAGDDGLDVAGRRRAGRQLLADRGLDAAGDEGEEGGGGLDALAAGELLAKGALQGGGIECGVAGQLALDLRLGLGRPGGAGQQRRRGGRDRGPQLLEEVALAELVRPRLGGVVDDQPGRRGLDIGGRWSCPRVPRRRRGFLPLRQQPRDVAVAEGALGAQEVGLPGGARRRVGQGAGCRQASRRERCRRIDGGLGNRGLRRGGRGFAVGNRGWRLVFGAHWADPC